MTIGGMTMGALLLLAPPSAAREQDLEQAKEQAAFEADARCALAFSTLNATHKLYSKEQMDRGWIFYVGRIVGRNGTMDNWGIVLEDAALAMRPGEEGALVDRCVKEMYEGGIPP